MKKILIVLAIVLALIFIVILMLLKFQMQLTRGAQKIKSESVLAIDLSQSFPERGGYDFSGFKFRKNPNFLSLIKSIECAADDENIIAISIDAAGSTLGFARTQELHRALSLFRESGKSVYAYIPMATMSNYYAVAAADTISMPESGDALFLGISISPMFFAGSAEKLGVGFDAIQIGEFKGAVDMFTEKGFTKPLKESLASLLDDIYGEWISAVAEGRDIPENEVVRIVDRCAFEPEEALDKGLIDIIEYPQDYRDRLLSLVDDDEDRIIGVNRYASINKSFAGKRRIAVVYCLGNIHTGESESNPFARGKSIGSETFSDAIDDAADDDDIEAIVLRVDSPGGSSLASDIIWKSVVDAKLKKPVVVSMAGTAASGGYYISMPADSIFCDPSTITGSIGVAFLRTHMEGLLERLGVSIDTLNRGRMADVFLLNKPMDDNGYEMFSRLIENVYADFTRKAAGGRKMELDSLLKLARGRVWTGTQAVENGLADRLAGLSESIDVAARMAGVDPSDVGIEGFPPEKGLFEMALDISSSAPKMEAILSEPVFSEISFYLEAATIFDPWEPLTIMPFTIECL